MSDRRDPIISATELVVGYGGKDVLHGVSINVFEGEVVAIIGHNGAGKSTLLKALFGLLAPRAGEIAVAGEVLRAVKPRQMISRGVSYLPQGSRVFAALTVLENLQIGACSLRDRKSGAARILSVLSTLPELGGHINRLAGTLSGGEKQMLALAIALVGEPRILLLDEPSLGLAPKLARDALDRVRGLSDDLGFAILVVEQKVREVLTIADRVYALRHGRVTYSGPVGPLRDPVRLREVYL